MRRAITTFVLCSVAFVFSMPGAFGQTPAAAPPGAVVIGSGSFSPIVKDLDKSLAFYRDLLGVPAPAQTGPTAFGAEPALLNFLGTPTAQVRVGTVRVPGTTMNVELVDFTGIDRKAVQPRLQDPGAPMLVLAVRDIDSLLDRLKKQGVTVVTAGGKPVSVAAAPNKTRAVVIKDPDGIHITLTQIDPLPETTAPAASNVIGGRVSLTVADTDQAVKFYRDALGLETLTRNFTSDKNLADLFNIPGAQVRRSSIEVPGSTLVIDFLEFKGVERKPIDARIQDPGATRLQLRVREVDSTVKSLVAAGGRVVTTGGGGGPIDMRGLRVAIVRELNNLFLVIFAQSAAPAGQRQ